jgi:hypothetical protein
MTLWTVQCGYAAYYANTVTVAADSLDAALERAIETANADPHWGALDDCCGPTFVDAAAEGDDADPWAAFGSALPIPDRFTEHGPPPLVTVFVRHGVAQSVVIAGRPARVMIRDYDAPGEDPFSLHADEAGARYALIDWRHPLPPPDDQSGGG